MKIYRRNNTVFDITDEGLGYCCTAFAITTIIVTISICMAYSSINKEPKYDGKKLSDFIDHKIQLQIEQNVVQNELKNYSEIKLDD